MLDLKRQYAPLHDELLAALDGVLTRQQFILGEPVGGFESAAAAALQAAHVLGCAAGPVHVLGCASGTDALWLALAGAGIGAGDAVVTTPFSFFASVSCILRAGARPVLADIDPVTFNLSPVAVKAAIEANANVKAVLPVHLYGQAVDWDAFEALGLTLVEDAAQAWGAKYKGRSIGTLGATAAFSFYPTKNLSAAGDAGAVSTMSNEIAARIKSLRQHGMTRRYYHDEVGWNARMDGFQGAVLAVKLKHIARWNEQRREAAARYDALLRQAGLAESGIYPEHGVILPRELDGNYHVWHQYVIRTPRRDALRDFLTARNIGSEIYYPVPLHQQDALAALGYKIGDFPESERAAREVLALPIFAELREDEQATVVAAIAEFLS